MPTLVLMPKPGRLGPTPGLFVSIVKRGIVLLSGTGTADLAAGTTYRIVLEGRTLTLAPDPKGYRLHANRPSTNLRLLVNGHKDLAPFACPRQPATVAEDGTITAQLPPAREG